jgi:hypothetical protein
MLASLEGLCSVALVVYMSACVSELTNVFAVTWTRMIFAPTDPPCPVSCSVRCVTEDRSMNYEYKYKYKHSKLSKTDVLKLTTIPQVVIGP